MSDEATYSKFLRFFTSRLVQTLVQARLGTKIEHECSGIPGQAYWFNVKIDELGEIAAYLRSAIEEYPPKCEAVTIEFLLYTVDGVHLPLESWVVSVDIDERDPDVNVNTDFYHKLGTVLRSTAAAARMTPMYRYFVKRQGQDTFVILYRIYNGTTEADLGKDAKHLLIAVLPTPFGAMNLDLSYRTDMTLPIKIERTQMPIPEVLRPSTSESLPCRPSFSDCVPVIGGEIQEYPILTSPSFKASPAQAQSPITPVPKARFKIGRSTSSEESTQSLQLSMSLDTKECAFGPQRPLSKRTESFPFEQLLMTSMSPRKRHSVCSEACSEPVIGHTLPEVDEIIDTTSGIPTVDSNKDEETEPSVKPNAEENELEEDSDTSYVKVSGAVTDNSANLSQFLKDCRMAPMNLNSFIEDDTNSLSEQLKLFSVQEKEFSQFVQTVNESVTND